MKKRLLLLTIFPVLIVATGTALLYLKHPYNPIQLEPLVLKDSPYQTRAIDTALKTSFQDTFGGHHKRGRALLAADFDLDGRLDFYVGNPGDKSFILRNTPTSDGGYQFVYVQTLLEGDLAWGGGTSDFDNDGDYDIFITCGANEGIGFDYMFRNDLIETGRWKCAPC